MKWFKHDSDARYDPKIQLLRSRFHNRGYGTLVCSWEHCADHGKEPGFQAPFEQVANSTGERPSYVRTLFQFAAEVGHIDPELWSTGIVSFPAMTQRVDETTRKRARKATTFRNDTGPGRKKPGQDPDPEGDPEGDLQLSGADQVDALIELWNGTVKRPIPKVRKVTPDRRAQLGRAMKTYQDLDVWRAVFEWMNTAPYGRKNGSGDHKSWTFSLDWICEKQKRLAQLHDKVQADAEGGEERPEAKGRAGAETGKYSELD